MCIRDSTGTGDYVVLTEEEVYDFMRRKAQENNQNQNSNHQDNRSDSGVCVPDLGESLPQ